MTSMIADKTTSIQIHADVQNGLNEPLLSLESSIFATSFHGRSILILQNQHQEWLEKALNHLRYSVCKLTNQIPVVAVMDEETLEAWEGLVSRFARASDIFFSKVLRTKVEEADPAFRGSFIDMLNMAEKLGYIEDLEAWKAIRELRNTTVHEYAGESINEDLLKILQLSSLLLAVRLK
jgi:hypothetical protein